MDELESVRVFLTDSSKENACVLVPRASNKKRQDREPVIEEEKGNEEPGENDLLKRHPLLRYTYGVDQWSPLNKNGKKVYDHEFLIKLRDDPKSKVRPLNLPDLNVVLKDNSRSNRGSMDLRQLRDVNIGRHDSLLFPGFVKSSQSARGPLTTKRNSQQSNPKSNKPAVIDVLSSHREDVNDELLSIKENPITDEIQLREKENVSKENQLQSGNNGKGNFSAERLHNRIRQVLNKLKASSELTPLTPLTSDISSDINQIKSIQIDSNETLQGVVDAVYEKAIIRPQFGEVCALMCQELSTMRVSVPENETGEEDSSDLNFRKLIVTRCVMEFEEAVDENARAIQRRETEGDEEGSDRTKSFNNIRFMGELFKQGLLTSFIMHRCMGYLLSQIDVESLDCLSKLLCTVGKVLKSKNQDLEPYLERMMEILGRKVPGEVSSRVLAIWQDVIELKNNEWVPRKEESNSKTIDQIQKEAETERLDLNNTPLNTPRKDDRDGGATEEDRWSPPVGSSRQQYSVETSKLKNKPLPMDNLQSDNKSVIQLSRNVSADAPKTVTLEDKSNNQQDKHSDLSVSGSTSTDSKDHPSPDNKLSCVIPSPISRRLPIMSKQKLLKKSADILEEYLSDPNIDTATMKVCEIFDDCTFGIFVRDVLSKVVNKSVNARKRVAQLLMHLISTNALPSNLYLSSLENVLNASGEVVIDVSKIWAHLAEMIWYPLAEGVHPFSELKTMMAPLKSKGLAGTLLGELMTTLVQEKSPKWIKDKWDQSGLEWSDFLQENESLDDFIKKYKLEFLIKESSSIPESSSGELSMEQIHERLRTLMSNEKENSFDNICKWISVNVGERASQPEFIKVLMTAILEVSTEPYDDTWRFKVDKFHNLQALIPLYVDANIKLSELQCLIAIQEYIHKLKDPQLTVLQILEKQIYESILSFDVHHIWESTQDLIQPTMKLVAMLAVKSFLTSLKEKLPMDNLQSDNKSVIQLSRNVSADCPKTITTNKVAVLEPQVGRGGNSFGAPGSRGPLPLGGIQNIRQSAAGMQQGGQTGAQQAPPQSRTPGVQSQQPQGPPPTTTPPDHTPSPQEMGKQTHLQAQPLQQSIFVTDQTRTASQVYYQAGAGPQAPRNLNHRGGQGGGGAQVVGIQGVGGGGGQPVSMYRHHGTLPVPSGPNVYMQGQVPLHPSHAARHQQPVYAMNSQMQPIQFSSPPQRHQGHQNQSSYPNYQPTVIAPNQFGYAPGPTTQHPGYFYAPPGTQNNMGRAGTGSVSGAAPHVGSPLAGGQGATVVQQGTIQQPSQQPQPMTPMPLPLGQTEVYPGHNGSGQNPANSLANRINRRRNKAIFDIVDPTTGKVISEDIYEDDAATQSGDSSNRSTPQPQNVEMIADFAAPVAKAATDDSKSVSPAASSNAPETHPKSKNAFSEELQLMLMELQLKEIEKMMKK